MIKKTSYNGECRWRCVSSGPEVAKPIPPSAEEGDRNYRVSFEYCIFNHHWGILQHIVFLFPTTKTASGHRCYFQDIADRACQLFPSLWTWGFRFASGFENQIKAYPCQLFSWEGYEPLRINVTVFIQTIQATKRSCSTKKLLTVTLFCVYYFCPSTIFFFFISILREY